MKDKLNAAMFEWERKKWDASDKRIEAEVKYYVAAEREAFLAVLLELADDPELFKRAYQVYAKKYLTKHLEDNPL